MSVFLWSFYGLFRNATRIFQFVCIFKGAVIWPSKLAKFGDLSVHGPVLNLGFRILGVLKRLRFEHGEGASGEHFLGLKNENFKLFKHFEMNNLASLESVHLMDV